MANRATQVAAQQQAGAARLRRPLSLSVHRTKAWKTIGSMGAADERQRVSRRAGLLADARLPAKAHDPRRSRLNGGRWADGKHQAADGVAARQTVRWGAGDQGAVASGWVVWGDPWRLREGGSPHGQDNVALNIAVQRSSGCGR